MRWHVLRKRAILEPSGEIKWKSETEGRIRARNHVSLETARSSLFQEQKRPSSHILSGYADHSQHLGPVVGKLINDNLRLKLAEVFASLVGIVFKLRIQNLSGAKIAID